MFRHGRQTSKAEPEHPNSIEGIEHHWLRVKQLVRSESDRQVKVLAHHVGLSEKRTGQWRSPDHRAFIGVHHLPTFTKLFGPGLLRHVARWCGYAVVPLIEAPPTTRDCVDLLLDALAELGAVAREMRSARAEDSESGPVISPREARDILDRMRPLEQKWAALRARLEDIGGE